MSSHPRFIAPDFPLHTEVPYYYLDLPTRLVSLPYRFQLFWIPKCACSSWRQWFLDIHEDRSSYHHIHCKKEYHPPRNHETASFPMLVCLRHPYDRTLSTFFQKHVFRRDPRYLASLGMRYFRQWLRYHDYPHCLLTYLLFLQRHHGMDIHEEPQTTLLRREGILSSSFYASDSVTILTLEDPELSVRIQQWQEAYLPTVRRRPLPLLNVTPKKNDPTTEMTKKDDHPSLYSLWSVGDWKRRGDTPIPSYEEILLEPGIRELIESIYHEDLLFWQTTFQRIHSLL